MTTLPAAFIQQIQQLVPDEAAVFLSAIDNPVVTSVRLNKNKPAALFINKEKIAWCNGGYYLKERPVFIADPLFHAGTYYVQESSSMFLQHVLQHIAPQLPNHPKILDLCAAPGGKSTLIADFLNQRGLLVSNEIIQSRVKILSENITRWGMPNVIVTNNDPKDFKKIPNYFDVIVIDAPCSGEGMFRKDKKAIEAWSPENVELCTARQQRILADVIGALKPNGFLIYSTCTFNTKENEENIQWLMNEFALQPIAIPVKDDWQITQSDNHGYRFYPHKVNGEGLFMCCLQKPATENQSSTTYTEKFTHLSRTVQAQLAAWFKPDVQVEFVAEGKNFLALPAHILNDYLFLKRKFKLVQSGVKTGELIKEQLIPDHALSLSIIRNNEIPETELDLENAKRFLRKETLPISLFSRQGWNLVTYQNYGLGWVKVLSGRVNNYFPTHWRVLKDI